MQFKATGLLILLVLRSVHNANAIWGSLIHLATTLHGMSKDAAGDEKLIQELRSLASQDAKVYDEVMHHLENYIAADRGAAKAKLIIPMLDELATMTDDELNDIMPHYTV